jgi:hypothetical protein
MMRALCAAMLSAGLLTGCAHTTTPAQTAPRACTHPSLPSGDAKRNAGGRVYVCTDGTWVHVGGYGISG